MPELADGRRHARANPPCRGCRSRTYRTEHHRKVCASCGRLLPSLAERRSELLCERDGWRQAFEEALYWCGRLGLRMAVFRLPSGYWATAVGEPEEGWDLP